MAATRFARPQLRGVLRDPGLCEAPHPSKQADDFRLASAELAALQRFQARLANIRPTVTADSTSPARTHPRLQQQRLERHARWRLRWRRRGESSFLLLSALVLAALLLFAFAGPLASGLRRVVELGLQLPLLSVLALGLLGAWRQRRTLQRFELDTTQGWLATLPIAPALQARARWHLRQRTASLQMLSGAVAVVAGIALGLMSAADAPRVCAGLLLAIALGLLSTLLLPNNRDSTRAPVLRSRALGWSSPPRWAGPLPQLPLWQRRQAIRGWRGGKAWVWLLPLGLLVLAGEGARVLAGMLILVAVLPWLRTTLDACATALRGSALLLATTPLQRSRFVASGWRYPASRALMASLLVALALAAMGAPLWLLLVGGSGFLLLCLLELALMLRYPLSRGRQRAQLMAELALLILLAQAGLGPTVLVIAAVRIGWHVHQSRRHP